MCVALLGNALRAGGVDAQVHFGAAEGAGALLRKMLPCGRAAVFADSAEQIARLRVQLAEYRPVCCVIGGEPLAGLFALQDEVRAVVAAGTRSIFAARFFATLRGGIVLALPLAASAEGLFEAALPKGYAQAGYPLRPPDAVLADEVLLGGAAEAAGFAALSALCAEDAAAHALFTGKELAEAAAFARAAEAFAAFGGEKQGLFCVCSLLRLALRGAPALPAAEAAAAYGQDAFPLFAYFAARYIRFLEREEPRRFFVPDHVGRVLHAAQVCGVRAPSLLKGVNVPTAEECAARADIFAQARAKLRARGELFRVFVGGAARLYAAHGGRIRAETDARCALLYECAAELSPLLSLPAMQREFGLLADLPADVCSAEHMRAAAMQG